MAIGGASGYLTVNPTQDYVGQALQGASDYFARVRAEKYQKERDRMANEQNLQEQRRRDFKDAEEFSAKYPFVAMGNTDIDSKNRQDLETGKQRYSEAMDNYYQTGDKKYLAVAESVKASINEAVEMPKALSLVVEGWQKNEADLNPSSLEKAKTILQKLKTDMVRDYDENGRSVYTIIERNEKGEPIKKLYDKISAEKVKELLTVEPKFDVTGEKGLISQFKKNLRKVDDKKEVVMTPKGEVLRTTNGYEGYEDVATVTAKELTKNHSAVYSALEELGLDPEKKDYYKDENTLKKVEELYKKTLIDSVKPSVSEVPYLDREKLNETKRQNKEQIRVSKGNLAVSQQRANYDMSEKTETSSIKLTPEGEKARQADIKKYGTAYPLSNYDHITTKKTVGTKSNSKSKGTTKTPTKAELKAKADALRAKYAPKK